MIVFDVNGEAVRIDRNGETALLYILAHDLGLFGPKYGCGVAQCGACMVLIGDQAVASCVTPLSAVHGRRVTTLAGLRRHGEAGRLQRAFIAEQAAQCGYCVSGVIIAAEALLRANPSPSEDEVRAGLDGNLCRCGAHNSMVRAVMRAAAEA